MCVGPKKENTQSVLAGHLGRPLEARGKDGDVARYFGRRLTSFHPGLFRDVLIENEHWLPTSYLCCLPIPALSHTPSRARWTRSLSHVELPSSCLWENLASTGKQHAGAEIRRREYQPTRLVPRKALATIRRTRQADSGQWRLPTNPGLSETAARLVAVPRRSHGDGTPSPPARRFCMSPWLLCVSAPRVRTQPMIMSPVSPSPRDRLMLTRVVEVGQHIWCGLDGL